MYMYLKVALIKRNEITYCSEWALLGVKAFTVDEFTQESDDGISIREVAIFFIEGEKGV